MTSRPTRTTRTSRIRPGELGAALALLLADAGAAIPYGLESGRRNNHVASLEWVMTGIFVMAVVALATRIFSRLPEHFTAWSYVISAGAWAATAAYAALLIDKFTIRTRVGEGLIFMGLAALAMALYLRRSLE